MADNVPLPAASGAAAADEVTYSGDTTKVQLLRLVHVAGTEGSKTLYELVQVDNAAFTDGTSAVLPVGYIFDEVAGTALTENDTGAARMDSKRAQVLTLEDATTRGQRAAVNASGQVAVTTDAVGASTLNSTSSDGGTALTSTAQAIKASAGVLKGYYIYNPNSAATFVCFYNVASASVTVGTTNPLFMLTIPGTSAANLWIPDGIAFSTAMSWAAASTAGGNGAPTTALDAVAWYK